MWTDNETSEDLLGFSVHTSILKKVVMNKNNLPITIGLYGDWGSGKSSLLKIIEKELNEDEDTVVIYFDGWSFESFDDAKMALIQGIIDELERNEKFLNKVEDKLNGIFKKVKKSVNWMRVLQTGVKTIIPIASAAYTGGASLIPLLISAFNDNRGNLEDLLTGDKASNFLNDVIKGDDNEQKYKAVREFRKDFEELIQKSGKSRIVILIDDLDRCLPRRIIDNLEAIKLFLNVPKTVFVVAADEFIVANAINSEYKDLIKASENAKTDRPNLGNSYMEKFIQLPYKLPALSNKEIETYITLLFCKSELNNDDFHQVQTNFMEFIHKNKFEKYGWENIKEVLTEQEHDSLKSTIGFLSKFSAIISNSLRRNPRLIKRFLNAYEIRSNLLELSGLGSQQNRFALLKLMLIEQKYYDQFKQLYEWVMINGQTPQPLLEIEKYADGNKEEDLQYKDWNLHDLLTLINTEPKFSSVDLRELYWVSRDNIVDTMSGTSLIPFRVKELFKSSYDAASDKILDNICKGQVKILSADDLNDYYTLLEDKLLTNPKDKKCYHIYYFCIMSDIDMAYQEFLRILPRISVKNVPFSLGNKFGDILRKYNNDAVLQSLINQNAQLKNAVSTGK